MDTTEFVATSLTLSCTLGPALGILAAVVHTLLKRVDSVEVQAGRVRGGFRRPKRDEAAMVAELKAKERGK